MNEESDYMIITLTGTPGTGKTTVAERLTDEGFEIVGLTQFLEEKNIGEIQEGEREVPVEEMVKKVQREEFEEDTVIEGHLSHHIPSDVCVVLRCRPDILEERLSERDYSDEKVRENVEAETLDVILSEAIQEQETVIEIDTTGKSVEETVEKIIKKVERGEEEYGEVDWTTYI